MRSCKAGCLSYVQTTDRVISAVVIEDEQSDDGCNVGHHGKVDRFQRLLPKICFPLSFWTVVWDYLNGRWPPVFETKNFDELSLGKDIVPTKHIHMVDAVILRYTNYTKLQEVHDPIDCSVPALRS